jgi:16S rRNA (adenine1518-N6/adenine1519-N6)-dimethyltransferase
MRMQHPSKIIKALGIAPLKKLGQNFQVDVHAVINAADEIPPRARILEVGPGLGAWTEVFLSRGHEMVLAEKDRTLSARLIEQYRGDSRVTVLAGDFLDIPASSRPVQSCSAAIGNLPFYVTSEILLRIITEFTQISHGLFGVQLEVAERLAQGRGSSLAIALATHGDIRMAGKISRNSFYPVPNVDAALIAFRRGGQGAREHMRSLLKAAFWGKRKTLGAALRKNPFWKDDRVASAWYGSLDRLPPGTTALLTRRADDLSAAEFVRLYDGLAGL